ncbi:MAG: HNH endonuclease [Actinomycetota bacterium]|nr:MAG: HNH endonuclease [Actinomycetota bacterium]
MTTGAAAGTDWGAILEGIIGGVRPVLPYAVVVGLLLLILRMPLPGRGPRFFRRLDPWRTFRFDARRVVLAHAGNRCEAPLLMAWGRCQSTAEEVDHIYPWSRGGDTVVSNGQALCRSHNRAKSNRTPAWWYVVSLERRRRRYYPAGHRGRVKAAMAPADRAAREAWAAREPTRRPASPARPGQIRR